MVTGKKEEQLEFINTTVDKKKLGKLLSDMYERFGTAKTADLANAQALRQETEDPVDRLALRFRETQLEAHIAWLHECMTTLAADRHTVST